VGGWGEQLSVSGIFKETPCGIKSLGKRNLPGAQGAWKSRGRTAKGKEGTTSTSAKNARQRRKGESVGTGKKE